MTVNQCVEGVGVNKATPNRGLHRFRLDGHGGMDELGDRGSEHGVTTTSSSSVREKNRTRPEDGWQGRMAMERRACGHCPFPITKIGKGCQRG